MPPLIASTLGSVDQTKCLTPASLAARTAAVACLNSSVPFSRKLVTRKTPYAPFECSFECFRAVEIRFDDLVGEFAMLAWIAGQGAHLELAAGLQGTYNSASLLPVAPITAITFLSLDDMSIPFCSLPLLSFDVFSNSPMSPWSSK